MLVTNPEMIKYLKNIKKGITVDQLRKFTSNAKKAKLKILADFVIGFPGETPETANETIRFIKEMKPDLLQVAMATPMPGTDFYKYCLDNNYILTDEMSESLDDEGFQKCIISYPNFNSDEISIKVNEALKDYYLNISYLPIIIKNISGENGIERILKLNAIFKDFS